MKKSLLIVAAVGFLASCSQEPLENSANNQAADIRNAKSIVSSVFDNGSSIIIGQSNPATARSRRLAAAAAPAVTDFTMKEEATPLQAGLAEKLTNEVFMPEFPNGENNIDKQHPNLKDLSFDFLYVSNGQPFEVYALYSHALYIDDIGIYYIDDKGEKHERDFWSMADDGWLSVGWNYQYFLKDGRYIKARFAKKDVSTYNQAGSGFTFQMPKGWKFGFYVKNDQNGQKYSESTLNERDGKQCKQVVTYNYQGFNLIGIEDIFVNNGSDSDYNDIVMMISPKQVVIPTGQVVVRYIDEEGVELLPNEYSGEMASGSSYTGKAKDIEGYELVDPTHTSETKIINEYDRDNIITFVYKKKVQPQPEPEPQPAGDIVITLGAIDKGVICSSDDFCIKYDRYSMEYAYSDGHSATNLDNLKLPAGTNLTIALADLGKWQNGEKTYWKSIGDGMERACFDFRLYSFKDANGNYIDEQTLNTLMEQQSIVKPEGYEVKVSININMKSKGSQETHISVQVDRPVSN